MALNLGDLFLLTCACGTVLIQINFTSAEHSHRRTSVARAGKSMLAAGRIEGVSGIIA
jgi:hypothetical protein